MRSITRSSYIREEASGMLGKLIGEIRSVLKVSKSQRSIVIMSQYEAQASGLRGCMKCD